MKFSQTLKTSNGTMTSLTRGSRLIVAYGGGIEMLINGTSPVEDRLDYLSLAIDDLRLTLIATHAEWERSAGEKPPLIEGVGIAQTGIARIIELQEKGYSYIKP